jgi:hypothetical protein
MPLNFSLQRLNDWAKSPYLWVVLIRLLWFGLFPFPMRGDAVEFHLIAENLLAGNGFSRCNQEPFPLTAQRPPLYPFLLAAAYALGSLKPEVPLLLNIGFDLVSVFFARRIAQQLKFKHVERCAWIIVFAPPLLAYSPYPTTENVSVMLFLAASFFLLKDKLALSGFMWGLLSLCRSYYLAFPFLYSVLARREKVKIQSLILFAGLSLAAPSLWVARNWVAFHKPLFSQTAMAGYQSYLGLCMQNFSWWDRDKLEQLVRVPELRYMMTSYCESDSNLQKVDQRIWQMVKACVIERPTDTAINFSVKTWNLFTAWGQLLPYWEVPAPLVYLGNGLAALLWFFVGWVFLKGKGSPEWRKARLFALIHIAYVLLITLPFSLDARYLLAPLLLCCMIAIQIPIGSLRNPK